MERHVRQRPRHGSEAQQPKPPFNRNLRCDEIQGFTERSNSDKTALPFHNMSYAHYHGHGNSRSCAAPRPIQARKKRRPPPWRQGFQQAGVPQGICDVLGAMSRREPLSLEVQEPVSRTEVGVVRDEASGLEIGGNRFRLPSLVRANDQRPVARPRLHDIERGPWQEL